MKYFLLIAVLLAYLPVLHSQVDFEDIQKQIDLSQYQVALEKLLEVNIAELEDAMSKSKAFYLQGLALDGLDSIQAAIEVIEKARSMIPMEDSMSSFAGEIYNKLGFLYVDHEQYEQAGQLLQKALDIRAADPNTSPLDLADTYYNLTRVYVDDQNNWDLARAYADTAILIFEKLDDPPANYMQTYIYRSSVNDYLDQTSEFKADLDKALSLSKNYPEEKKGLINIYINLGNYYEKVDDNAQAVREYNNALIPALEVYGEEHWKTNDILFNLSLVKGSLRQFDEALEINQRVLKNFKKLYGEHSADVGDVYKNIGNTYSKMKDDTTALVYFEKAQEIYSNALPPNSIQLALAHLNTGESYYIIGAFQDAIDEYNRCHDITSKLLPEDHIINAAYHYYTANALTDMYRFEEAIRYYEKVEDMFGYDPADLSKLTTFTRGTDLILNKARCYNIWYDQTKDPQYLLSGKDHFQRGFNIMELSRNTFSSKGSRDYLMKKYRSSFENALLNLYQIDQYDQWDTREEFFMLIDDIKNTQLKEAVIIDDALVQAAVPDSISDRLVDINTQYYSTKFQLNAGKLNQSLSMGEVSALENELQSLEQEKENSLMGLQEKHPVFYDYVHNQSPSLTEMRDKVVAEDEALINIFMDEDFIFLACLTEDHLTIDSVHNDDAFAANLKSYVDILKTQSEAGWEDLSHGIFQKILERTIVGLPDHIQLLTIIPEHTLCYLPFETLIYDPSSLAFLGNRYQIRYAYSTALLQRQSEVNHRSDQIIAFAPKYDKPDAEQMNDKLIAGLVRNGEYDLPGSKMEVKAISKLLQTDIYMDEAASKNNFISAAHSGQVLHLSMHALVDHDNPLESRLVFSQGEDEENDFLHAYELYGMNIASDMVVLSACNTGIGKIEDGEGVMSLSRAFTQAGVPSTLTSLWQVPDDATSEIMTAFYRHLKDGKSKSKALQAAKRDYIDNTIIPARKHPYYWSGFIINGSDAPLILSEPTSSFTNKLYLPLLAVMALIMGLFIRRRRQ